MKLPSPASQSDWFELLTGWTGPVLTVLIVLVFAQQVVTGAGISDALFVVTVLALTFSYRARRDREDRLAESPDPEPYEVLPDPVVGNF